MHLCSGHQIPRIHLNMFHVSGDLLSCFLGCLLTFPPCFTELGVRFTCFRKSLLNSILVWFWCLFWGNLLSQIQLYSYCRFLKAPPLPSRRRCFLEAEGLKVREEGEKARVWVVHDSRSHRACDSFVRWKEKGVTTTHAARVKWKKPCDSALYAEVSFQNAFVSFSLPQCSHPLGRGGSL